MNTEDLYYVAEEHLEKREWDDAERIASMIFDLGEADTANEIFETCLLGKKEDAQDLAGNMAYDESIGN